MSKHLRSGCLRLMRSSASVHQVAGPTACASLQLDTTFSQQPGSDSSASWSWVLGALLGGIGLTHTTRLEKIATTDEAEHPSKQTGWHLLDATTRRKTFYKYERRIRDLSQPDKVFHYFASRTLADGTRVMTANDLICAIVAVFPPEQSTAPTAAIRAQDSSVDRSGSLAGEPRKPPSKKRRIIGNVTPNEGSAIAAFDSDLDGISYSEYVLLLTFLKFPAQDVKTVFSMFDLDSSGKIEQKEFEQVVDALQSKLRRGVSVQRTGSDLKMKDSSVGLKRRFFGDDGRKTLCLEDFSRFIEGLHEEMLRLEFEHYDLDQDETIQGIDFARSILSAVSLSSIDTYLDRAAQLPDQLKQCRIDYHNFRHFCTLYQHVHTLAVALDFFHHTKGRLEPSDFKRATRIVTGTAISDDLVDIVYGLFDLDGDGNLSSDELIAVLRKREGSKSSNRSDEDERNQSLFSCFYNCAFRD